MFDLVNRMNQRRELVTQPISRTEANECVSGLWRFGFPIAIWIPVSVVIRAAASLIGRLGQVHFIVSFPSLGIWSLIRVKLLFAVIVGPVRLDRCMQVSDRSRSAQLSLALRVAQQPFSASSADLVRWPGNRNQLIFCAASPVLPETPSETSDPLRLRA